MRQLTDGVSLPNRLKPNEKTHSLALRFRKFTQERGHNSEERIRLRVYIVGISLLVLLMVLHLVGGIGLHDIFLQSISWAMLLITLGSLLLFLYRRLTLVQAISSYALLAQTLQSTRIVYLAVTKPDGYQAMILGNQIGSYTILLYLVMAFIPRTPIYVTAISLGTLAFASLYEGGAMHLQFVALFVVLHVFTCILAHICRRGVHDIQRESSNYQSTQEALLKAFRLNEDELMAYLQLCRAKNPDEQNIYLFFDKLDDQSKFNLINAVKTLKANRDAAMLQLSQSFPMLSESELTICRLVAAGKTLSAIARITGKSSSNVSTVRCNIRKKLGLKTEDDLQAFLLKQAERPPHLPQSPSAIIQEASPSFSTATLSAAKRTDFTE